METPLGSRIKKRLKEIGKTQTWLGEQVNLGSPQITHIIKGKRGTGIDKLIDIGMVLGIGKEEVVRLYRGEKAESQSGVRKEIEKSLDRIERIDQGRLDQVADYVELLANSLRGKRNAIPKKQASQAQNK